MNEKEPRNENFSDRAEAFLDGGLSSEEKAAFLNEIGDSELNKMIDQQRQIDVSLNRLFGIGEPTDDHIVDVTKRFEVAMGHAHSDSNSSRSHQVTRRESAAGKKSLDPSVKGQRFSTKLPLAWLALAASLAFVGLTVYWVAGFGSDRTTVPFFQPTQLVQLYDGMIEHGFEPYYECDDEKRFSEVFEKRLGIPLALAPMPEGTEMLGLSYSGGISRDTTAMLCHVSSKPVVVFVDRVSSDLPAEVIAASNGNGTYLHRIEKHDLVFYEVTPFEDSRVVRFMCKEESRELETVQ